jgi:hypothetical protein
MKQERAERENRAILGFRKEVERLDRLRRQAQEKADKPKPQQQPKEGGQHE